MKIVKRVLFAFWGVLTLSLLIFVLIQRQDAIKSRDMLKGQEAIFNNYVEVLDEYARNMQLIRSKPRQQSSIDSIFRHSDLLRTVDSINHLKQ